MTKRKEINKMKKYAKKKKKMREKCMRPQGREPTICGLKDSRADHFATESATSMENY